MTFYSFVGTAVVIVPSWGDGVIDVILDTVHEALVTPPGILIHPLI